MKCFQLSAEIIKLLAAPNGPGVFFLDSEERDYEGVLDSLKADGAIVTCYYLNKNGGLLREEKNNLQKCLKNHPGSAEFLLIKMATPLGTDLSGEYLHKIPNEDAYKIFPCYPVHEGNPKARDCILIQIKHHPLLEDR